MGIIDGGGDGYGEEMGISTQENNTINQIIRVKYTIKSGGLLEAWPRQVDENGNEIVAGLGRPPKINNVKEKHPDINPTYKTHTYKEKSWDDAIKTAKDVKSGSYLKRIIEKIRGN